MNLSFFGPILVELKFCGFLGLFWAFFPCKKCKKVKCNSPYQKRTFWGQTPPPWLSYVYCIDPTRSGVISRVGNFWVRCSALCPPCWGMMMKMLKRTTTRPLPDANFCLLKRPFWGTFYRPNGRHSHTYHTYIFGKLMHQQSIWAIWIQF